MYYATPATEVAEKLWPLGCEFNHVRIARHAGLVFCIIGFLLIGWGLFDIAGGRIYQAWRGRELDRTLESLPPRPETEHHRISYESGSAIGRLEIPRLGLSVVVLEGSDTGTLRLGVGRLHNSAQPGEPGNVVLAGHRDTFFRSLRDIRQGDEISLRTPQGTFPYTVDWTSVVNPADTGVLMPTATPALTLVTCYPFYYVGSAPRRFIVRALPNRVAAIATPSTPSAPAPPPRRRTPQPKRATPVVAVVDVPTVAPEPPPLPKRGIKRFFHKLAGVFSPPRAKLQ